jgi:hypothetical protein
MTIYDENDCTLYRLLLEADKPEKLGRMVQSVSDPNSKIEAQSAIDHIIARVQASREALFAAFRRARFGDDNDCYELAQTLGAEASTGCGLLFIPPGVTQQQMEKALDSAYRQCLKICKELAERDHPEACLLAASLMFWGQGCPIDEDGARTMLDKAESLGVDTPYSQTLREQLGYAPGEALPQTDDRLGF